LYSLLRTAALKTLILRDFGPAQNKGFSPGLKQCSAKFSGTSFNRLSNRRPVKDKKWPILHRKSVIIERINRAGIKKKMSFGVNKAFAGWVGKGARATRAVGRFLWCLGVLAAAFSPPLPALADQVGAASGLPVPRYVSLKSDRVNLREGPSKDHRTTWVFQRAGLPVEITAESETWRRIRDSEGVEGWVLHSLLSGRRTALVAPWRKNDSLLLYSKPNEKSDPVARLQANVIGGIAKCDGAWCRISGEGFDGYIQQTNLWGVYPNEKIE
jgi:SH3-like domain-containing protein